MIAEYEALVPKKAQSNPYLDLVPVRQSTVAGGPRARLRSSEASMDALSEAAPELGAVGQAAALGGKTLLAAMADLASALPGGNEPSVENLRAYASNPEAPLPVEEGLAEMRGLGSVPTKAAAGLIRAVPAIGASIALGGAGAPAPLAAALPMSGDESGAFTPGAAAVGAVLPGVAAAGERAVVEGLARLPMKEVAIVLSRDPLRIKGKVVQQFGPINLSDDTFRAWLETGGGALAANAFLLATQAPGIAELRPEDRQEAILDSIAANVGPSLLGFAARRPMSQTLERMAPDIMAQMRSEFGKKQAPKPAPEEPAAQPPPEPQQTNRPEIPESSTPANSAPPETVPPAPRPPAQPISEQAQSPAPAPGPGLGAGATAETPSVQEPPTTPTGSVSGNPYEALIPGPEAVRQAAERLSGLQAEPGYGPGFRGAFPEEFPAPSEDLADRLRRARAADQPPTEPSRDPGDVVANWVRNTLAAGQAVSNAELGRLGESLGLMPREVEDWAELGSTVAAREIVQTGKMTPRERFAALVDLYRRMPSQSERTTETKRAQQYSTPPPLAYVGTVLADFASHKGVTVDPTAGHGMLLIGAYNPWGNELQEGRRTRLAKFLGQAVPGAYDATSPEFQDVLTRMRPARLGINPPFGTILGPDGKPREVPIVGHVTKMATTTSLDTAIALNSLEAMPPEGKAFVIMGAKTGTPWGGTFGTDEARAQSYRRPALLEFFERFVVKDWFTIGGDLYRKMGAAWPIDMVIIDGKGKTPKAAEGGVARPWVKPPRVIETWEQLAELLPADETDQIRSTSTNRPGSGGGETGGGVGGTGDSTGSGGPGGRGTPPVYAPRPEQPPANGGSGGGNSGPGQAGRPEVAPQPLPIVPVVALPSPGVGNAGTAGEVDVGGTSPGATQGGVAGRRAVSPGTKPAVAPSVPVEGLPASLMVPYAGVSKGPSLNLVAPRNIANQMLEAQRALEADIGMSADAFVADRLNRDVATLHQQMSGAQIDGVALAIRNIERGSALVVADETGVGKGRMAAAVIEYVRQRGMVPVFVTAKKNLYTDMVSRDLVALGNKDFVPFVTDGTYTYEDGRGRDIKGKGGAVRRAAEMEEAIRTGVLPGGAQAIFTTYDQLKGDRPQNWSETPKEKFRRKRNREERPDGPRWAMLRAFAPRSVFILDEAHLAAGKDSELNLKFFSVLPLTQGSYYSSATFAKRPDNLGLYALGTSIRRAGLDSEQLAEAMTKGGVPLQQALTSMLASSGELVRRQQDWTGVGFRFEQTTGNPDREVEAADTYTGFLRELQTLANQVNQAGGALEDGDNQVRPDDAQVNVEAMNFGFRLFNLSNQYLFALRADTIAEKAVTALRAGRKPFIAVYNTMEGPMADLRARKLPLSFNGILVREMQKMLTLNVRDPLVEGGKRVVQLTPESLPDGGAFYRELESRILAADMAGFPISPIDSIKAAVVKAGFSMGEITARESNVEQEGGEVVLTKREKLERNKILKAYNDGELDGLIVNGSGSTGLSAHTDPRFKDQRQREMIVGQPAPDINEFMQMIGRVMRSGQTSKPVYRIVSTALAADRRFATMLRGKMTSLNANTTADGESQMTSQEGFTDDIFNVIGDRVVGQVIEANPEAAELMGMQGAKRDEDTGDVAENFARFATGKFVLLPNAMAEELWSQIIQEYRAEIARLDEQGQNPLRAVAEDLRAETLETTEFVGGAGATAFDGPAVLERVRVQPPGAPPSHDEAVARARGNLPAMRQAAQEWTRQSHEARQRRVRAPGLTEAQIQRLERDHDRVTSMVAQAFHMLGETWGVDVLGDGSVSFYGVAVDLKLKAQKDSDFTSASRHELVLATNQFKGRFTIPLSRLFKDGSVDLLKPVGEEEAAELFRSTAESSLERYIVTGNLLKGWERADVATSGREGRPRVAIYTKAQGGLGTGVIMPPTWAPGVDPAGVSEVMAPEQWEANVRGGISMRSLPASAVHPVILPAGGMLSVPSNTQARILWGDPAFNEFFETPPVQRGGQFLGRIERGMEARLFSFLKGKGIRMATMPVDAASSLKSPADSRGMHVTVRGGPGRVPSQFQVQLGGMQYVRPMEMPELVRLARELSGAVPKVRPMRGKVAGEFEDGGITLDSRIFKNPDEAARVLAHELGHLVDYLPDATLRRGNLIGHLNALRKFLAQRFGTSVPAKELRAELIAVTQWWRPYNPKSDPPSYVKYRETPEELYADALSVLFNAPDQLEARAPKFYGEWWKAVDARPEVRDALFAVQQLLGKGRVATAEARGKDLEVAFAEGERRWKAAIEERKAAGESFQGFWTHFLQGVYWEFWPLERLAKQVDARGVALPMAKDPRVFLDELGYRDVTVMAWGRRLYERVIQPAEAAGISLEDLGKVLFYDRILNGDRAGLANPGGTDPAAARLGLLMLNLQLGLPKMTLLRGYLQRFHDMVFDLSQEAMREGAYSKEVFQRVIQPNRNTYATFAVLDYLQDHIPAGIQEQIGTLKDVANPFQATVLKSLAVMHLIAWQRAKNRTVDFLQTYFPDQIERVPSVRTFPKEDHAGVLTRLENGRPAHYKVDQYVAEAFTRVNPRQLWRGIRLLDTAFRRIVYPFIITYNIPFLYVMSPARDLRRSALNSRDVFFPTFKLLKEYVKQLRTAGRRYLGIADPLVREMEANLAVGTPFDQIARANRDDFMAELLKQMRVLPNDSQRGFFASSVFNPVRKLLEAIEFGGLTLDFLAKAGAYKRLRNQGMQPRAAAIVVRNDVGLPNILKRGKWTGLLRGVVPFINVAMQGWRADARVMSDPKTAGGWWLKWALSDGFLKVLMAAGSAGLLGGLIKELMDGIGSYDKENYLVVPLGKTASKEHPHRTVYLRLPQPEHSRMIGGLVYRAIQAAAGQPSANNAVADMLDFGMGQMPGVNPVISVPAAWMQFSAGINPVDPGTGREVVGRREWAAGGLDALRSIGTWSLDELGMLNLVRWDPTAATAAQVTVSAIPGVAKFIKTSDQGFRELQRETMSEEEAQRAKARLELPGSVQALEYEYNRLARLPQAARTEAQQARMEELSDWHQTVYKPAWEALELNRQTGKTATSPSIRSALERDSAPWRK